MSFATAEDVAARLGRATSYEGTALDQVEALLELADDAILDAVDKTRDWADEQDPVAPAFRAIAIEAVARVLLNPAGARSTSRQLGSFQESASFRDGMGSLELTDSEVARARRAVWGVASGSAAVKSVTEDLGLDDVAPITPLDFI